MPETDDRGPLGSMAAWEVPHAAAVLVGDGGTLASFGDIDRPFRLASVTKLLTAYACLVAVEEGTISLDERAGPPGATVRHLLAHTAGYGFDDGVISPVGQRRIYSNTGFDVLAEHLGARSGMEPWTYVGEAVIEPLAMTGTDLRDRSLAHGAWSTAGDLALFAAELSAPTLVHHETLDEATTVQYPGLAGVLPGFGPQDTNDWGLGVEIRDHKSPHWTGSANAPETFGHFGGAGTFLWVDPTLERTLVVLTDRAFGPWAADAWPALSDQVVAWVRSP